MAVKHIPEEIIVDILSRLPVKSLIRCGCVSKRWNSIISDPQFAKFQFKAASEQKTTTSRRLVLDHTKSHIISLGLETASSSGANFSLSKLTSPFKQPKFTVKALLGSCNGLVCLCIEDYSISTLNLYICNPSIVFLHKLPDPRFSAGKDIVLYGGIGHLSATDDYKVVVAATTPNTNFRYSEVKIFSCRTGLWKRIASPISDMLQFYKPGALLRETIHWTCKNRLTLYPQGREMFAFDLVEEEFREMPLPNFDQEHEYALESLVSDSCDGYLHVIRYYRHAFSDSTSSCVELWVMREYGSSGSWTKLVNLQFTRQPDRQVVLLPLLAMVLSKSTLNRLTDKFRMEIMRIEHESELLEVDISETGWEIGEIITYEESLLQIPDYHAVKEKEEDTHCKAPSNFEYGRDNRGMIKGLYIHW